jgi:hypothetical protein
MDVSTVAKPTRLPRFRRGSVPPTFRLTDDDIVIVRLLARHRFLRSTHIAVLVGRSLDRTNDRLKGLFHHGYVDRPLAQLDYYPTSGSAPMVYALANRGARLLIDRYGIVFANVEWSRKNREAGRPFIEHQLEIVDFQVGLALATSGRSDVRLVHAEEMVPTFPDQTYTQRNPFALRAKISEHGTMREVGLVPDFIFGLALSGGSHRYFVVEIDRGTMPVVRTNFLQTSYERKMRAYITAYAANEHERHFGWKPFRVLTVTTDQFRLQTMMKALQNLHVPHSPGGQLFYFTTRADLATSNPLSHSWCDGRGREVRLI